MSIANFANTMAGKILSVLSLAFIATALYHFTGMFYPVNEATPARHTVFVVINCLMAWALLKRPPWFVYVFALLLLQQLYSHGGDFIHLWQEKHQVDWVSLGVLLVMPLTFTLLIIDKKEKRGATARQ